MADRTAARAHSQVGRMSMAGVLDKTLAPVPCVASARVLSAAACGNPQAVELYENSDSRGPPARSLREAAGGAA